MVKIGSRGIFYVGDLYLTVSLTKIIIKIDCIQLNILCHKPLYGSSGTALRGCSEAVCNKNYTLYFALTEQSGGKVKSTCDITAAVVNGSLLYAFNSSAGGGEYLGILAEADYTETGV